MYEQNCNENIIEPKTVLYKDYKNLIQEYNNLEIELNITKSDLDCKIEIMSMLEFLIISKGSEEIIRESTIKMADILKKYIKA